MRLLPFMSLLAVAVAAAELQLHEEWKLWKAEHGKMYNTVKEELERQSIWQSNKAYIEAHNANLHIMGFELKMNHLGDLTDNEYLELYHKSYVMSGNYTNQKIHQPSLTNSYPDSVDWRTKGAVGKVKDQGQCGASYAFSAMGALEGAWALAHDGKLTLLSEQNIIDCSIPYSNVGCYGGNMYNTFRYVIDNDGVDTLSYYSFRGKQSNCDYSKYYRGASMSGGVSIQRSSETALLSAVANVGPVSVAVDGRSNAFRFVDFNGHQGGASPVKEFYYSGVYDSSTCSSSTVTHAMLVTGFGQYGGKDYWLVKNSWGTNWGMNGYILMSRNKYNQCGIATDASYPTL